VIDLHTHVLPGIDDGPEDVAAAVALVRAASAAGTNRIVATSHVSRRYPNSATEIGRTVEEMRRVLADEAIDVELIAGAEVSLARAQEIDEAELKRLRLGGGPYLLVESPLNPAIGDFEWMIASLAESHRIALAHPERCPAFQRDPDRLVRLVARGAICSITAGAVRGDFGRDVKRFTLWLFERGLVHNVASDTHDLAGRRPEVLEPLAGAEKDLPGVGELVSWLTETVPAAVLAGEPVGTPPHLRRSRRAWRRR
jgi:protein-tyrosine phosphatase